jgi:hypothetical protein
MEPLGKEKADYLEIFVVVGRQPTRVSKRFLERPFTRRGFLGMDKEYGSEKHKNLPGRR